MIEKMKSSLRETQQMSHIIKQTNERKGYIAQLCIEVVSREGEDGQIFYEVAQYAKELEASGISKENAAMRAFKKCFVIMVCFTLLVGRWSPTRLAN